MSAQRVKKIRRKITREFHFALWAFQLWFFSTWLVRKLWYRAPYQRCSGWEGPCTSRHGKERRQNTYYQQEASNWNTLCPKCQEAADAYWKERWDEYYAGCM